jgi:bifunctional N-acetylglucosamine-1-phosphate-uridyltransferase/glucosamine-1-phosphate-acetyltransferase GlmU-like protein
MRETDAVLCVGDGPDRWIGAHRCYHWTPGQSVRETFADAGVLFVEQRDQLGTGHAVLQAAEAFRGYQGNILILCGDVPLLKASTLEALIAFHETHRAVVTVMTVVLDDPGSYGRIVKNDAAKS